MHGRKSQNMRTCLPELRVLLLHDPVGTQKNNEIEEDQSQRDDRPSSGRHVLMLDWNEHSGTSVTRKRGGRKLLKLLFGKRPNLIYA
jgi:hypothetical protein